MNKELAFKNLKEARDILNKLGVQYFLMGGTLLGFMREKDFIPHDDDMDIGVFSQDWTPKITEEFQAQGWQWASAMGKVEQGLEYRFIKDGIQLDVFFWYKESDYYWYAAWWKSNAPENIIKLRFDPFQINHFRINEEIFNIPSNPEHWLEQIYGQDWRTPNSDWHWCASVQNIIQAPFDNKKDKTICLGMVVKNEAHIIRETLEVVKPYIDTWVIIDTGSTDETKSIIKETLKDIPGELIERPWVNFGHNRTELATYTRNKADFTITLDADEIIHIEKLNKKHLIADYYMVNVRENCSYYANTFMNNKYEWRSVGVTHECWEAQGATVQEYLKHVWIEHRCCGANRNDKFNNDLKLLLQGIKDEPKNSRYVFYLAQTYYCSGQYELAIEWYQKRIDMGNWWEEVLYSMIMITCCHKQLNHPMDDILEQMFKTYFYYPKSAEVIYEVLRYCRIKGMYNIGYYIGKIAQKIPFPTNLTLFVRKWIYEYGILDELSICAYYIGKYKESYDLCDYILKSTDNPDRERIEQNKKYSEEKLK